MSLGDREQRRIHDTTPPEQVRRVDRRDSGSNRFITPGMSEDSSESTIGIMDDLASDDEITNHKDELVLWIRALQEQVRKLEDSAARNTSEILGRTQMQCERDTRTYHRINALVTDKIFSFKKFIVNQRDLDDFTENTSLGMVIMNMMKIDMPDRLPFWNAYKEIVADLIANRRTTITNDLKKVVMSKYRNSSWNDIMTHEF